MRRLFCAALAVLVASSATPPAHAAWPNAPGLNRIVCNAAGNQQNAVVAADGGGGVYVAWEDFRSGTSRVFAQHVLASGVVNPAWPVNGLPVSTVLSQQALPRIVADGAGGAIVTWEDTRAFNWDLYAQRLTVTGVDATWPAAGRAVNTNLADLNYHASVTDGAGGVVVAWVDWRNFGVSGTDVYAQRVRASGVVDPAWPVDGRALVTAPQGQGVGFASDPMAMVADGSGGAIVTWTDQRAADYDLYATRVRGNGALDPAWPVNGLGVCTAAGQAYSQVAVEDGSGGMLVAWLDFRSTSAIYVHHITAGGTPASNWPLNGLPTSSFSLPQDSPAIASDGAGGALIFWSDYRLGIPDVYAQHVIATGIAPGWPTGGVGVCTDPGYEYVQGAIPDGAGGALVWWSGGASVPPYNLSAQHLLSGGGTDFRWPPAGRALSIAATNQFMKWMSGASDGAGGLIVAWGDARNGGDDVYAQRVARHGYLGTPEAVIAGVDDVPNDQGGKVKLSWYPSYLDAASDPNLTYYDVYRSVPPNLAQQALARGARRLEGFDARPDPGVEAIVVPGELAGPYFWEYVTYQNALHFIPNYSLVISTLGDSTPASNPLTAFMIVARSWDGNYYWLSAPDSGYSADNLPPATPAPFTGEYQSGVSTLHWNPNLEPDLVHYRLYRGITPTFVPGPSNLVASPADTGYVDAAGGIRYYKLSAVDVHGNESGHALLLPVGTVDVVGGAVPLELALGTASPNPARTSARFALALPRAGRATLAIYDAGGRRVRELLAGELPAGEHARSWDLRDETGHPVAPGLYFAALEVEGSRLTRRFSVMR